MQNSSKSENSCRGPANNTVVLALRKELDEVKQSLRILLKDRSHSERMDNGHQDPQGSCKRKKMDEDNVGTVSEERDDYFTIDRVITIRRLGMEKMEGRNWRKLIHLHDGRKMLVWKVNLKSSASPDAFFKCHDGEGACSLCIIHEIKSKTLRLAPYRTASHLRNSVFDVSIELITEDERKKRDLICSKSFVIESLGGFELCRIAEIYYEEFSVNDVLTLYVSWRCAHNFERASYECDEEDESGADEKPAQNM